MKTRFILAVCGLSFVLAGCASPPQKSVDLKPETLTVQGGRVGVVMTQLPKVNTYFPGADCLLCMAGAEMMNSSLTGQTKNLTPEDLPTLKNQAADILRKRGLDVTVLTDNIDLDSLSSYGTDGVNVAKKNFSSLAEKYKVDKLVVFNIDSLGFVRPYSAYIPAGDPKAMLHGVGYMVNLKTNTYEWYAVVDVKKAASGNWDEAPAFPGLTNAYFQVIELSKDKFLQPLAQ